MMAHPGPETTSEKSRKKRGPVSSGNPAFIPVSPLGSRDRQGEEHAAGGGCSGRRSNLTHKSHPGGRIVSPALTPPSSSPAGGIQNIDAIRSTGGQQVRDDGERPEVDDQIGESRAAEPTSAFDELSRWRLSRGSVPKMARLAVEVGLRETHTESRAIFFFPQFVPAAKALRSVGLVYCTCSFPGRGRYVSLVVGFVGMQSQHPPDSLDAAGGAAHPRRDGSVLGFCFLTVCADPASHGGSPPCSARFLERRHGFALAPANPPQSCMRTTDLKAL